MKGELALFTNSDLTSSDSDFCFDWYYYGLVEPNTVEEYYVDPDNGAHGGGGGSEVADGSEQDQCVQDQCVEVETTHQPLENAQPPSGTASQNGAVGGWAVCPECKKPIVPLGGPEVDSILGNHIQNCFGPRPMRRRVPRKGYLESSDEEQGVGGALEEERDEEAQEAAVHSFMHTNLVPPRGLPRLISPPTAPPPASKIPPDVRATHIDDQAPPDISPANQ